MSLRLLALMLSLALPATAVLAQDAPPEGGDVVAPEGEPAADMPAEEGGDTAAAPTDDAAAPAEDSGGADKPISVGLLLGYGIGIDTGNLNPFGLGFGARGGYNIDKIFLGARFVYYLGGSETVAGVDFSTNVWEFGIEGGYDVDAGGLTIRPGLGLGLAGYSVTVPSIAGFGGGSASTTNLYVAPGVGVLGDVSEDMFIGAEARFMVVLASGGSAKGLILLANAGMRF